MGKSQWSSFIWGFMMESLRDLGKSQWSSFIWGVYDGITARFGKISMEFFHLGGLQGNQTVVSKVQVMSTRMGQ